MFAKVKQLICVFVFAYANSRLSHDVARFNGHIQNFLIYAFLFINVFLSFIDSKMIFETFIHDIKQMYMNF